jgi:hypothetical protein
MIAPSRWPHACQPGRAWRQSAALLGFATLIVSAWLGEWSGISSVLWARPRQTDGCPAADDCVWAFLFAPDATNLPLEPDRWVAVTGHFNDPAALTCRATGSGPDAVPSNVVAIEQCREHFVVTRIVASTATRP